LESHALIRLRRSLILVAISYGYFLVAFGISRRSETIPTFTELLAIFAGIISLVGFYFSRKIYGLWIMISGLTLYVIYVVFDPQVEEPWMQLSVLCAIVSISVAYMSNQERYWKNVFLISVIALFNFWSYFTGANSLLASGSFLGRGSISSFMVFTTGIFVVIGWRKMLANAETSDQRVQTLMEKLDKLQKSQEKQKNWHHLVVRIHETTLNTLRSLIAMREVEIETLKDELKASVKKNQSSISRAQETRAGSVISAIRSGIDSANFEKKIKIISKGVNLHLESDVFDAVERIVRESLRNATTHGNADFVEVHWRTVSEPQGTIGERERGILFLEISDDGESRTQLTQVGIGTHLVMASSVEQLGGKFELIEASERGRVIRVELPTSVSTNRFEFELVKPTSAIELGKYMALLTLFGPAMTGIIFFPLLGIWWEGQLLTQILGFIAQITLFYISFVKMKRMGWLASTSLAVLLLLSLKLINVGPLTCTSAQPIQWIFNITVYGLFIIMLGGKWQITAVSYPIFLYLARDFSPLVPNSCNFIFAFPLINTLMSFLFVWIVFYIVYKSLETVENSQLKRIGETTDIIENLEGRDRAYQRVLELDERAQDLFITISEKSGKLQNEDILSLRKLDSELRAQLQIEPMISNGLTLLASDFISKAVSSNRWLEVKSIHGDVDERAIPEELREKFFDFARDISSGSTIHVVVGPEDAHLSLTCKGVPPESLSAFKESADILSESELKVLITDQSQENHYVVTISRPRDRSRISPS